MNSKKKTILVIIFFLIFFTLFFIFLILPTLKEIMKTSKDIALINSKLMTIEQRRENINEFKKNLSSIKENLKNFENSLVNKDFPIDFINFLERIAQENQVSLDISSSLGSKEALSFQAKATGLPADIFRFLEKIENCHYLVQIEKLIISKISEQELKVKGVEETQTADLKIDFLIKVQTK